MTQTSIHNDRSKNILKNLNPTDETFSIPWDSAKLDSFKIYTIENKFLKYNFNNARIAGEKYSIEFNNKITLEGSSKEDQHKIQKILLDSVWFDKHATKILKESLETEQRQPAIITFDGIVIDGNRRLACLNQLHKETGDLQYSRIKVCVLPKANQKKLLYLENQLQLAKEFKIEYGPINERIRLKDMLEKYNFDLKEIAKSVNNKYTEKKIKKMIDELKLIDAYLIQIGRPNDYASIAHRTQHFIDLLGALDSTFGPSNPKSAAKKAKFTTIGFQLISNEDSSYKLIREYNDVLNNNEARDELIQNSTTYKNYKSGNYFDPKLVKAEIENVEIAHEIVRGEKDSPTRLAGDALTKLKLIKRERIKRKDNKFIGLLNNITERISELHKMHENQ